MVIFQSKGEEIDSLLFSMADVSRQMDRNQARDLEQKTDDLRTQWSSLQHIVGKSKSIMTDDWSVTQTSQTDKHRPVIDRQKIC